VKTHVVQTFPIPAPELEMGQIITAIAVALDLFGAPIDKGPVTVSRSSGAHSLTPTDSPPVQSHGGGKQRSD